MALCRLVFLALVSCTLAEDPKIYFVEKFEGVYNVEISVIYDLHLGVRTFVNFFERFLRSIS